MRQRFLDQMPFVILAILCLGTALMTDRFLSAVNISNVMLQASVMAVVAMGMTYVIISGVIKSCTPDTLQLSMTC